MTGQRPDNPLKHRILREVTEATQTLALAPQLAEARRAGDIDSSFAQFAKSGIKAVLIAPDAMLWLESKRIARLAIAAGIADTQFSREGAEAGSLFSYATGRALSQVSD